MPPRPLEIDTAMNILIMPQSREVQRPTRRDFAAGIARAKRFFKLERPDDPLFAMDSVVECACRELSGSAASLQTGELAVSEGRGSRTTTPRSGTRQF
jgi:hypothetical protein